MHPHREAGSGRPASARRGAGAEERLVAALARPGAYATLMEGEARLAVFAAQRGVTLRVGTADMEAAEALARRGCAEWSTGASGRRRLCATEDGLALARRLAERPDEVSPFLAQHVPVERRGLAEDGQARPVLVNADESPLAWLHRRKGRDGAPLIDAAAFAAGERLRSDLTMAQMLPRVTANWSANLADGARGIRDPASASDAVIAARQRASRALDAVGRDMSGLLLDVCGFLKGLDEVERERSWPRRSAKIVLRIALDRLAAHYGISNLARGPERGRRIGRWRAQGARPMMGALAEPS